MNREQFKRIIKWQAETFGSATPLSKIAHLKEEIKELEVDVKFGFVGRRLEFADCFLLLFGSAAADGMTYDDIVNAIEEKFQINLKRKWGKPDANGVINHIKD